MPFDRRAVSGSQVERVLLTLFVVLNSKLERTPLVCRGGGSQLCLVVIKVNNANAQRMPTPMRQPTPALRRCSTPRRPLVSLTNVTLP